MLSEAFLRSLNRLRLDAPRRMRGVYTGERPSKKRGRSVEFADYRAYTPGDDPRRLDWNILARHGKTFIKLFEDEEDATVTILLDASGKQLRTVYAPSADVDLIDLAASPDGLMVTVVARAAGDWRLMQFDLGAAPGSSAAAPRLIARGTPPEKPV